MAEVVYASEFAFAEDVFEFFVVDRNSLIPVFKILF